MYVSAGFRFFSILLVVSVIFAHSSELLEESIVLIGGDKFWGKCVYANIFKH